MAAKPEENISLGRSSRRSESNIKMVQFTWLRIGTIGRLL
jgi:hypothetical protein